MYYLKAIKTVNIIYGSNKKEDLIIKDFSNSNLAGDYDTKKSNSSFIFILNSGPAS